MSRYFIERAFLAARGRPVVVAATKMDKLGKSHRFAAVRAAERGLGLAAGGAVPFSAVAGTGTDALWARILEVVRAPPSQPGESP